MRTPINSQHSKDLNLRRPNQKSALNVNHQSFHRLCRTMQTLGLEFVMLYTLKSQMNRRRWTVDIIVIAWYEIVASEFTRDQLKINDVMSIKNTLCSISKRKRLKYHYIFFALRVWNGDARSVPTQSSRILPNPKWYESTIQVDCSALPKTDVLSGLNHKDVAISEVILHGISMWDQSALSHVFQSDGVKTCLPQINSFTQLIIDNAMWKSVTRLTRSCADVLRETWRHDIFISGILCSVQRDAIIKSMVYRMEFLYARFRELTEELHRPIDQCVHIIDVEGYGPKQLWKPGLFLFVIH